MSVAAARTATRAAARTATRAATRVAARTASRVAARIAARTAARTAAGTAARTAAQVAARVAARAESCAATHAATRGVISVAMLVSRRDKLLILKGVNRVPSRNTQSNNSVADTVSKGLSRSNDAISNFANGAHQAILNSLLSKR